MQKNLIFHLEAQRVALQAQYEAGEATIIRLEEKMLQQQSLTKKSKEEFEEEKKSLITAHAQALQSLQATVNEMLLNNKETKEELESLKTKREQLQTALDEKIDEHNKQGEKFEAMKLDFANVQQQLSKNETLLQERAKELAQKVSEIAVRGASTKEFFVS
jgi:chromosome segregation ATPase